MSEEKKLGLPLTQYMVGVEEKHLLAKGEMNFIKAILLIIIMINCFISLFNNRFGMLLIIL